MEKDLDKDLMDIGFATDGVVNYLEVNKYSTIEWDGMYFYLCINGYVTFRLKGLKTIDDFKCMYKLITGKDYKRKKVKF